MKRYKIQIFNYITPYKDDSFLWITNTKLDTKLELLKSGLFINDRLPTIPNKYDKEEDLNLMQAKAWEHKLTKLGVECEIVEIDYSKEN